MKCTTGPKPLLPTRREVFLHFRPVKGPFKSFKELSVDYVGDYIGVIEGDSRSLDYMSYINPRLIRKRDRDQGLGNGLDD